MAGTSYTCGLTTDGEIYCWGINNSEMQGHGLEDGGVPLAQEAPIHPVAGGHTWRFVIASHAHTCGITTTDETYCWGNSQYGRLGIGTASGTYGTPQKVLTNETFTEVAVGWVSSCGITAEGKVYCWGNNVNGRLGNGSTENQNAPVLLSPIAQ